MPIFKKKNVWCQLLISIAEKCNHVHINYKGHYVIWLEKCWFIISRSYDVEAWIIRMLSLKSSIWFDAGIQRNYYEKNWALEVSLQKTWSVHHFGSWNSNMSRSWNLRVLCWSLFLKALSDIPIIPNCTWHWKYWGIAGEWIRTMILICDWLAGYQIIKCDHIFWTVHQWNYEHQTFDATVCRTFFLSAMEKQL